MKKVLSLNDGWIFCKEGVKETVNIPHTWNGLDGQGACGEDGYFRMLRGSGTCGINTYITSATIQ